MSRETALMLLRAASGQSEESQRFEFAEQRRAEVLWEAGNTLVTVDRVRSVELDAELAIIESYRAERIYTTVAQLCAIRLAAGDEGAGFRTA